MDLLIRSLAAEGHRRMRRRREGLGPRASLPDFAGIVPATRGLIAARWTPASLSLLPAQKRVELSHRIS
jgi:hypothetical protein